jgi:hypothetical protein
MPIKVEDRNVSSPVKIYFDESGFTGNNLLHPGQTIFSYGSVQTDEEEASEFVQAIIEKYGVQGGELKGKNLIKYSKGRRAITEILAHFNGRMKASVSEKKYALAAKFFEYIFEPPLQRNNLLFYKLDFHRFVSNILYVEFIARGAGAEEIFEDFEYLMRTGKFEGLESLFSSSSHPEISPILSQIREFAILNRAAIAEELNGYAGQGAGKWVLDLTNTALFSLLAKWGQHHDQVTAICDQSKPLSADQALFDVMINRTDKKFSLLGEEEFPITFNLSESLKLVDSKITPGVQIADCIAAAFAHALNRSATDEYALEWRKYIGSTVIFGSVFADLDYVDLNKLEVQRNAVILVELLERSRQGVDLLAGMPEYAAMITEALIYNPIPIKA